MNVADGAFAARRIVVTLALDRGCILPVLCGSGDVLITMSDEHVSTTRTSGMPRPRCEPASNSAV